MHAAYLAEKDGNLQHLIEAFGVQRKYMNDYSRHIDLYSADDNFEGVQDLGVHASLVGIETAHLHPFQNRLLEGFRLAGLTAVQMFKERFSASPFLAGLRSMLSSSDGSVRCCI